MEEAKLLSYLEFREKICTEGKNYFQNPQLRKQNFELRIKEEKDAYGEPEEMAYIFDHRNPELHPPAYSVLVSYETYCRSKDADRVLRMLSGLMEQQYPIETEKAKTKEEKAQGGTVQMLPGDKEQGVPDAYVILGAEERLGSEELQEDGMLPSVAEREQANLQLLPLTSDALLVLPLHTAEEYEENLGVLNELQKLWQEQGQEPQVYDKDRNLLLKDTEEIRELLVNGKVQKKGIFSR